jgi:hypothetical protein
MHPFRPRILLFSALLTGLSACSITAQPAQETTTTLAPGSLASDLVLLEDGLGPFRFGDSGTAVIEGVTAAIGGWDSDSSDSDSVTLANCDDGVARIVSWGSLVLTFVERNGAESFTGWSYGFDPLTGDSVDNRHLALATPDGIRLGSGRSDLIDTYGDTVSILDNAALDTATFHVAGSGSTQLAGKLDSAGSAAIVDFLETTPGC